MKFLPVFLITAFFYAQPLLAKILPVDLVCEYMNDPSIVDVKKPRLGWIHTADEDGRGQYQTAWQNRVASSPDHLSDPDLWDSKKINPDHPFLPQIIYYELA